MSDPKKLAAKIAADLFTDGLGRHAVRLGMIVNETDETAKLGGYCEAAVADTIEEAIMAEEQNKPLSSGSAEDDAVALTALLSRAIAEIEECQGLIDDEVNRTDANWLMMLDMVAKCEIEPQRALRILDNRKLTGRGPVDE